MSYTPVEIRHVKLRRGLLGYRRKTVERLLEGLGSALRLAAVTCETFLGLQATALSGFDQFFGVSFRWGHEVLLDAVRVCGGGRLSTCHTPLALVQTEATSASRAPRTACFLFSTSCGIHTSERSDEFPHRLLHVASA